MICILQLLTSFTRKIAPLLKFLTKSLKGIRHSVRIRNRPAKSYTALQSVRHHFNIYADSCVALALDGRRGDGRRKLVTRFGVIWRV